MSLRMALVNVHKHASLGSPHRTTTVQPPYNLTKTADGIVDLTLSSKTRKHAYYIHV